MARHTQADGDAAARPRRLGMLVPSSTTVLEPETAKLLPRDGSVTCHVSRLPVVTISSEPGSLGQFDVAPVLAASALLADARADLILWNGTAASWLGFGHDVSLTEAITRATGTPATTAVIAINETLAGLGARRIGLVTPYVAEIETGISHNYAGIGIDVIAAERLDLTENFAFGTVPPATVAGMIRAVGPARPDAIVGMCTNFAGAPVAEALSDELGIPVSDSVRAAIGHCLARLGGG